MTTHNILDISVLLLIESSGLYLMRVVWWHTHDVRVNWCDMKKIESLIKQRHVKWTRDINISIKLGLLGFLENLRHDLIQLSFSHLEPTFDSTTSHNHPFLIGRMGLKKKKLVESGRQV